MGFIILQIMQYAQRLSSSFSSLGILHISSHSGISTVKPLLTDIRSSRCNSLAAAGFTKFLHASVRAISIHSSVLSTESQHKETMSLVDLELRRFTCFTGCDPDIHLSVLPHKHTPPDEDF